MPEVCKISATSRFINLAMDGAITEPYEALIELITNSVDSYNRKKSNNSKSNNSDNSNKKDKVYVKYSPEEFSVQDYAEGLSCDEAQERLFLLGGDTAGDVSRGAMGRGFNDIFYYFKKGTCICTKNNKISEFNIDNTASLEYTVSRRDVDMTKEEKEKYGKEGVFVNVSLVEELRNIPFEVIKRQLQNNYQLRSIYINSEVEILLEGLKVEYEEPEKDESFFFEDKAHRYEIEGYPGVFAELRLYRSKKTIDYNGHPEERRHGVLVTSEYGSHDVGFLDYDGAIQYTSNSTKSFQKLFGYLHCPHIGVLIKESASGVKTTSNPWLLIKPSRRGGLDGRHPFIKALYKHSRSVFQTALYRATELDRIKQQAQGELKEKLDNLLNRWGNNSQIKNVYTWRNKESTCVIKKIIEMDPNIKPNPLFFGVETQFQIVETVNGKLVELCPMKNKTDLDIEFVELNEEDPDMELIFEGHKTIIQINTNSALINKVCGAKLNIEKLDKWSGAMLVLIVREGLCRYIMREMLFQEPTPNLNTSSINDFYHLRTNIMNDITSDIVDSILTSLA